MLLRNWKLQTNSWKYWKNVHNHWEKCHTLWHLNNLTNFVWIWKLSTNSWKSQKIVSIYELRSSIIYKYWQSQKYCMNLKINRQFLKVFKIAQNWTILHQLYQFWAMKKFWANYKIIEKFLFSKTFLEFESVEPISVNFDYFQNFSMAWKNCLWCLLLHFGFLVALKRINFYWVQYLVRIISLWDIWRYLIMTYRYYDSTYCFDTISGPNQQMGSLIK